MANDQTIKIEHDGKTIELKVITKLTGAKKKAIGKILATKPVDEISNKIHELIQKNPDITSGNEKQIGLALLQTGVVSASDLSKYQSGDYIPKNYDDYLSYIYNLFRNIVERTDSDSLNKILDADASENIEWFDDLDIEQIESIIEFFRGRVKYQI